MTLPHIVSRDLLPVLLNQSSCISTFPFPGSWVSIISIGLSSGPIFSLLLSHYTLRRRNCTLYSISYSKNCGQPLKLDDETVLSVLPAHLPLPTIPSRAVIFYLSSRLKTVDGLSVSRLRVVSSEHMFDYVGLCIYDSRIQRPALTTLSPTAPQSYNSSIS